MSLHPRPVFAVPEETVHQVVAGLLDGVFLLIGD